MSKRLFRAFNFQPKPKAKANDTPLTNGLLKLPPELWPEIFMHAGAFSIPTRSISAELQDTQSTYCALWHDMSTLSNANSAEEQPLLTTRHDIILVCKAWYQLGISALYSHVLITLNGRQEKLNSLYKTLKKHPSLASLVIRLSINENGYGDGKELDKVTDRILAKLFPLIPNVRIFVSPLSIIQDFYSSLHPEVIIIKQDYVLSRGNFHPMFIPSLQFASRVHTLCFKNTIHLSGGAWCPCDADLYRESGFIFPPVEFPNLVNLQLQFERGEAGESVVGGWILPRLRTLSIMCDFLVKWMHFIRRHAKNLESLEIIPGLECHQFIADTVTEVTRIQLPKLDKICIFVSNYEKSMNSAAAYINLFVAPRLTQFCYQIGCVSDWFHRTSSRPPLGQDYLKELGDRACEVWPTIRELSISYRDGWSFIRQVSVLGQVMKKTMKTWEKSEQTSLLEPPRGYRYSYHEDTKGDILSLLQWLVGGWVEENITVIVKHRQMTELVFPRKNEGGVAAMMEYRSTHSSPKDGWM